MQDDPVALVNEVGDKSRDADTQINDIARPNFCQSRLSHCHSAITHLLATRRDAAGGTESLNAQGRLHEIIDVATRGVHVLGFQYTHLNNIFDLRDYQLSCRRHSRIKILLSHPVNQITGFVGGPRADKRNIAR